MKDTFNKRLQRGMRRSCETTAGPPWQHRNMANFAQGVKTVKHCHTGCKDAVRYINDPSSPFPWFSKLCSLFFLARRTIFTPRQGDKVATNLKYACYACDVTCCEPSWRHVLGVYSPGQTVFPTQANSSQVTTSKLASEGGQTIPTSRVSLQETIQLSEYDRVVT